MKTNHCNKMEAIIIGEPGRIMPLLARSPLRNWAANIQLSTLACFPPFRWSESFSFPAIRNGDMTMTLESLDKLFRQRAVNDDQYEKLNAYIHQAHLILARDSKLESMG